MSKEIMQQALDALKYHQEQTRPIQNTIEAIEALEAALAQPEQAPFKPDWVSYRQGVADGAAQREQEPVHFLANGVRYKVTHQGYYGCSIVGLPENLNGQWVALVEATDSKHLNCITLQESTKPEQATIESVYETIVKWDEGGGKRSRRELARRIVELYTTPHSAKGSADSAKGFGKREWVGLTDDEIKKIMQRWRGEFDIRDIERLLKDKNT